MLWRTVLFLESIRTDGLLRGTVPKLQFRGRFDRPFRFDGIGSATSQVCDEDERGYLCSATIRRGSLSAAPNHHEICWLTNRSGAARHLTISTWCGAVRHLP